MRTSIVLVLLALAAAYFAGGFQVVGLVGPSMLCMVAALVLVALVFWPQDDFDGGFGA